MRPARSRLIVGAACLACLAAPGVAQDDPPAGTPSDPPADLLRGPSVPDEVSRTLVQRGMTRGFVPVEGRPEIAAVRLLDLDEAASARVGEAVNERTVRLATLLVDRIDVVREITDAVLVDQDADRVRELQLALWDEIDEGRPRDPLLDAMGDALTPDQIVEAGALLDEYWGAWIDWELRNRAGLEGDRLAEARRRTRERLGFALFQAELREAYDVSLRRYREAMEAIYNAVDPTDEQRAAIRSLVIQHIKDTRLEATIEQRRAAMRRIYDLLDPERQGKLFDYMLRVALPG